MAQAGIMINIVLMVLNLLPLPPLDGGRIAVSFIAQPAGESLCQGGAIWLYHFTGAAIYRRPFQNYGSFYSGFLELNYLVLRIMPLSYFWVLNHHGG